MTLDDVVSDLVRSAKATVVFELLDSENRIPFMNSILHGTIDRMHDIGELDGMINDLMQYVPEKTDLTRHKVKTWWKDKDHSITTYGDDDKYLRYFMWKRMEELLDEEGVQDNDIGTYDQGLYKRVRHR